MPTRYLKESICSSESLAQLSAEAERFWYRLLVQCDDYGRMDARPIILRALCFPLMLETISTADISRWLGECETSNLLHTYTVKDKAYLVIPAFTLHNTPRAKSSKWPDPPGIDGAPVLLQADASKCTQTQAAASSGKQIPSYSESESESYSEPSTEVRAVRNAYDASGLMMTKTHLDIHLETIKKTGLQAWQTGWATAMGKGKQNAPNYVARCAESAMLGIQAGSNGHGDPYAMIPANK